MRPPSPLAARRRVQAALELVHAPETRLLREVSRAGLTAAARDRLWRLDRALLRHAWALLRAAYRLAPGRAFFSVHRAGDPRNCLWLTPDQGHAAEVAGLWAGPPVEVTRVDAGDLLPERHVALALALHWRSPPWLSATTTDYCYTAAAAAAPAAAPAAARETAVL